MSQKQFNEEKRDRLAVKLTADGERILKHQKHPWIFSDSISSINREGKAGDIVIIYDRKRNTTLGVGLYDPSSSIRIKMLYFGGSALINDLFFEEKIKTAFELRSGLLQTDTNSYRLLFGENDGFPGLIADVYADVLVLKLYSEIWFSFLHLLIPLLEKHLKCSSIILRLSRNLQTLPKLLYHDGQLLFGRLLNEEVAIKEHGIHFSANVVKGHKTGFFLDHRHNRKKIGEFSKNKTVLDVFSYAGGFSVHALVNGAKEVTSVDISAQALAIAKMNAGLSSFQGVHHTVAGDAFKILQDFINKKRVFDVVVIDPPSFAKAKTEVTMAKRKYNQLAGMGIKLTASKGLLVLASCTSRITAEEFYDVNEQALLQSGRNYTTIEKTLHDSDHPVTFKEGAYLKCAYYRMDS